MALAGSSQADSSGVIRQADHIMEMTYPEFIDYKTAVTTTTYPNPFNWGADGCSGLPVIKETYRTLFDTPCQMHDFGYRNYGRHNPGLDLSPNEDTRAWIDGRFYTEMKRLCKDEYGFWAAQGRAECLSKALVVYSFVRNTDWARNSFYSESR